MTGGARLVARSLARSWRRHPLRAGASLVGVVVGVMLATAVASVSTTMVAAVRSGTAADVIDADFVAVARSANGMSDEVMRRLEEAAGPADTAGVVRVNTRHAEDADAVLVVFGLTPGAERLAALGDLRDVAQEPAREGTVGLLVGEPWARHNGLDVGDVFELEAAGGAAPFTVSGVLDGELPNEGAIALGAIDQVDEAFGRNGGIDAVYFRLDGSAPGSGAVDQARQRVDEAGAGSVTVGPPSIAEETGIAALNLMRTIFSLVGVAVFAVASAVLLVCWRLLLDDERPSLARFRLVGGGTRHLALGSGLVFGTAGVLSAAVGVPLGFVVAGLLEPVSQDFVSLTGLAGVVDSGPRPGPALVGVVAALVMCGLAWATGLRSMLRSSPIEGFRSVVTARPRTVPLVPVLAGAVVVLVGFVVARATLPSESAGAVVLLAILATVLLACLAPTVVGRLLARGEGFVGLAAGRELAVQSRRRAAMVGIFAVANLLVVLLFGVAASLKDGVRTSVQGWTGGDLFVLAGKPGLALRDQRLAADTSDRLARIPGVDIVTPFSLSFMNIDGKPVQLWAWETDTAARTADLRPTDGVDGDAMWDELARGHVAVSENFAHQHDIEVGEEIEIPSSSGTSSHEVVALIPEYTVEGGVVYTSMETFEEVTGDDRAYDVLLNLEPGADRDEVAAQVRQELSGYPDLVVWTGTQMLDSILGTAEQAFTVLDAVAVTVLVLALLVGATTSAASVAARRAPLAMSRVIGASARMTRRQLWLESGVLGIAAWVIALPIGIAAIGATIDTIGAQNGFFPPTVVPVATLVLVLPLTVAAMAASLWLPARSLLRTSPVEALRDE